MAIKVRLPNARFIKVDTDDPEYAKARAAEYYNSGEVGFIDDKTKKMATKFDKEQFDYETGVNAPWLRAKLGAMESMGGKERILEEAVGGEGFTRNSRGDLALTKKGLEKLGINPTSNKNVVIDESGFSFNDFADFSGIYGPIIGSIAGSIVTRGRLKPKYPGLKQTTVGDVFKISAGTGVGAAAGKASEEAAEYVAGLQDNSLGEVAEILAKEAAIGAGGEAVFGFGGKFLKYTFGQKALSKGPLGADDLRMADAMAGKGVTDSLTGKNYKGAVAISALDSPLSGLFQGITETVSKYQARKAGIRNSLITDTNNLIRSTNDLSSSFSTSIDDIIKTGYGDSTADLTAGKGLKAGLTKAFDDLNVKLDKANNNVKSVNDGILAEFDAFSAPSTTQAGEQIREATYNGYKAWDETQRTIYEEIGKFFEIPNPKVGTALEGSKIFSKGGLGRQAEFIDASPLKEYVDILTSNVLDTTGKKLDPTKAGAQLADFQSLINKTGKKLSLQELLELRSGLASANRITEAGAEFASLGSSQRSDMLTIIDETLARLENGEGFAAESLQSFFTKNLDESREQLKLINLQIEDLEKVIQGPSTPPLRNLIDDVSKTSDDARVQANQAAYNDVFDSQNADIQSKISEAQNKIAFAEINLAKAVKNKSYNQQILNDGIDPRDRSFGSGARELTPEQRAGYEADLAKAENLRVESNNTIIKSKEILDQIEADPQFVSYRQVAQQELKLLERDMAYHQKVIDDITNNNKIDINKIEAQISSIKIANKFYSSGMQAFDQNIVKKIMFDAAAGGHDVDKILTNIVLKKNNGDQVKRFLETLDVDTSAFQKVRVKGSGRVDKSKAPTRSTLELDDKASDILANADIDIKNPAFQNSEKVRGVLQREFVREIVQKTQRSGVQTNYRQIANAIEGYGTTGDVLFGSTKKNELIRALRQADDLVAVGNNLELERLLTGTKNVDNIIEDLQAKVNAGTELDELGKIEVFKKIQNGNIDSENIVNTLFKAGNSEDIVKVKQILGPDSVEFKQFQQSAMRKLLSDYVQPGDDVIEKLFNEGKFYDAMFSPSGYGEAVLKETFGEAQFKALREAAKKAKFAVGGERASTGGGLFTQGLLFKIIFQPLQSLPMFGTLRFMSWFLGRPSFVKWLSGGIPNKVFMQNELPNLYQALGIGQPIRRAIGTQIPTDAIREGVEYTRQRIEDEGVDPKAPIAVTPLELPEVESTASLSRQGQAPISRSLLGNSPANLEIAERRLNEIDQGLQGLA